MISMYKFTFLMIMGFGSVLFSIMIFLAYLTKSIKYELKNKLYILFLILTFLFEVAEIILVLCYGLSNEIINLHLGIKLYWLFVYLWDIWLLLYCLYYYTGMDKANYKKLTDLFKHSFFKAYLIIVILGLIAFFLIPIGDVTFENFAIAKGNIPTYVMGLHILLIFVIAVYILCSRKEVAKDALGIIALNLFMSLAFTIAQFFLLDIAVFTIANCILLASLYLFFENPDLYTIEEIEMAKDVATKSKLSKTEFLANISHDIKSPMNTILDLTETILNTEEVDEDKIKEDLRLINLSSRNLMDTINNIIDISKVEGNTESLIEREYSLKKILMNLSSIITSKVEQKPVKFIMKVDESIPDTLQGDSTKIYQLLLNILSNSVKNTDVGKISLSLDKELKGTQIILKFRITDSGTGIKEEIAEKLAAKLSQEHSPEQEDNEGKGVGLTIVKKYVDLMNGRVWFESEYGAGTSFYVEIPQTIVSMTPLGDVNISTDEMTNKDLKDCSKYRILIVDDDYLSLQIASRLLSRYKLKIDTCNGGKDCIYKIKSGEKYDLIFLDPIMPELDGVETLHVIKKLQSFYNIPPVIALTANVNSTARQYYLKEGFDEYLSKPINLLELDIIINKYLSEKENSSEADE